MRNTAINAVCNAEKGGGLLDKEANEIDWLDALVPNCLNEELISSLNICESDYIMLTFHDCTEGNMNALLSAVPAVDGIAANKISSISMEVTLLDTQLISPNLTMGMASIISQCALFGAQQSFSWLLCECCLVWVAMTGQPEVDHQLRGDGWFVLG